MKPALVTNKVASEVIETRNKLLDKFATNAMNGILACNAAINVEDEHLHDTLARAAYQMALAMMKVRKEYLK